MREQGQITQKTISFFFQPPGQGSSVDFGAPALSKIRDEDELVYINLQDDFYWA